MALVGNKLEMGDMISLADISLIAEGPLMDSMFDPRSEDYRPDLLPTDPDTGKPLMDDMYDPQSPDYRADLEPEQKSITDLAKADWVTSKIENWITRQMFEADPDFEHP